MAVYYFVCGEATLLTGLGANRSRAAMDAPTGEQPMDVLGTTNTLHRVSTEHLLLHRPPVTCVFPSARENPFTQPSPSFRGVTPPVYVCVCVGRARASAYACVSAYTCSTRSPPSPPPPPPPRPSVRPSIRTTTTAERARTSSAAFVLFATFQIFFCGSCGRASALLLPPRSPPFHSARRSPATRPRLRVRRSPFSPFRSRRGPHVSVSRCPRPRPRRRLSRAAHPRTFAHLPALIASPGCKETRGGRGESLTSSHL